MPAFIKTKNDEAKWDKAKEASGKETDKGSKGYWKLSNFIFHKMKKSQGLEKAEEFLNSIYKDEHLRGVNISGSPKSASAEIRGKSGSGFTTKGKVQQHKETLGELKSMPKPNLPKSEELEKALKFDHPPGYVPSKEKAPQFKEPSHADHKKEFKGHFESEVTHVKPHHSSGGEDTVYLKTGHVSHGHKAGKFKVGDKVSAKQHIMGTHILEHKKSEGMAKAEEQKVISPKAASTSVANPMKAGEQTTISKTPKAPGMFKSEDFKDVKHPSARKLRDFMTHNRAKK